MACNNTSNVKEDNNYLFKKMLFKYQASIDITTEIKQSNLELKNDSIEVNIYKEVENTALFIDSIKLFLINHFNIKDPNSYTTNEIINYSCNDSLFSYISLNQLFCGEGEILKTKYNAWTLRKKIEKYYTVYGPLNRERLNKFILYPRDYRDRQGAMVLWEFRKFYKTNLLTTLITLEEIKQDIYLSFINYKYQRRHGNS